VTTIPAPLPLDPPTNLFASDNSAGAHPTAIRAIAQANTGGMLAYGEDPWSTDAIAAIRTLFDADADVQFTFGGTGANVVALGSLLAPHEAVVCAATAHLHVDECGAPERVAHVKLLPVASTDGRITPADVRAVSPMRGDVHHPQPRAVALSQTTEAGTVYSLDQLRALADVAHEQDMAVFIDGARLTNAAAALGVNVAEFTTRIGADAVVMGGTKAGLVFGEAVVFLRPEMARFSPYVQKGAGQLISKQRFVAAQFLEMLTSGDWHRAGEHANAMAARLFESLSGLPGLEVGAPEANALFVTMPRQAAKRLAAWSPFWVWSPGPEGSETDVIRLMCGWSTTEADIEAFVAGVVAVIGG